MGQRRNSEYLLGGLAELRPDDNGKFDELVVSRCDVHFEMMADETLWIGIYPKGAKRGACIHVTVSACGKLSVVAQEA